jgi:hypothetical protein
MIDPDCDAHDIADGIEAERVRVYKEREQP